MITANSSCQINDIVQSSEMDANKWINACAEKSLQPIIAVESAIRTSNSKCNQVQNYSKSVDSTTQSIEESCEKMTPTSTELKTRTNKHSANNVSDERNAVKKNLCYQVTERKNDSKMSCSNVNTLANEFTDESNVGNQKFEIDPNHSSSVQSGNHTIVQKVDNVTSDIIELKDIQENQQIQANLESSDTATESEIERKPASVLTSRCILPSPIHCLCENHRFGDLHGDCLFVYNKPRCIVHSSPKEKPDNVKRQGACHCSQRKERKKQSTDDKVCSSSPLKKIVFQKDVTDNTSSPIASHEFISQSSVGVITSTYEANPSPCQAAPIEEEPNSQSEGPCHFQPKESMRHKEISVMTVSFSKDPIKEEPNAQSEEPCCCQSKQSLCDRETSAIALSLLPKEESNPQSKKACHCQSKQSMRHKQTSSMALSLSPTSYKVSQRRDNVRSVGVPSCPSNLASCHSRVSYIADVLLPEAVEDRPRAETRTTENMAFPDMHSATVLTSQHGYKAVEVKNENTDPVLILNYPSHVRPSCDHACCSKTITEIPTHDDAPDHDSVKSSLVASCRYYSALLTKQLELVKDNLARYIPPTDGNHEDKEYVEACTMKPSAREEFGCQTCKHRPDEKPSVLDPATCETDICRDDKEHLHTVYYLLSAIEGRLRRLKSSFESSSIDSTQCK